MAKAEKYVLESKNLKMFFKEDFLKKVESNGDIFPISVVFMAKEKIDENSINLDPIIFSHQNDK